MKTINELTQDLSKVIEYIKELQESGDCENAINLLEDAECALQLAIDKLNDAHEANEAEKAKAH
jgi:hypothetical protein